MIKNVKLILDEESEEPTTEVPTTGLSDADEYTEVDMNTYDGRGPDGTPCVFPFEAYGATHYGCTRLQSDGESLYDYYWCATTPDFSPGGPWKKCSLGM